MTSGTKSELAFLSIEQAARLLRRKELSPVELTEMSLARIERLNPSLNAYLTVVADRALRQARQAEREILRKRARGLLHGIPISLKDNFWTRGIRTTAGSTILDDFVPRGDSEVAAKLGQAGAILLGKTNMHEFAYGITSENPHYGSVRNPWALDRISGGSSGGSAAAVAAGMCFASVGTDTGGSIRVPSALCGIVGLKPTFGLVSVAGVVPLSESLDHVGPLARSATDACILLQAISGKYPKAGAALKTPDYRKLGKTSMRGLRLGWPKHYFFERVDSEVRRAIEAARKCFETLGARIEEVPFPNLAESVALGTNIPVAEAARYHESQGYYPERAGEYGDDVRQRLRQGYELRAVEYFRGLAAKVAAEEEFEAAFEHVDAILAPASPIPAPMVGQDETTIAGETETVRSALVRLNRPANITGHPAISVPCGFTQDGLPIGLQLIGPRWGEAGLLGMAFAYEQATEWHERRPALS
jgi:aspartyl-tRNA(Asn)/glutamyl-tRNA(Gln) amidotransferase subunit A